eukprot:TRINITY_DN6149_c0_g2_i1.p1 TRINITY_DN6149_c0_g2~~TRINITY_DN6149_c0_g2_i1.p1  ORF type:complete len:337 (-),score=73.09 TRINITY_DN6149_c0_g2_i1:37-981(-)
MSDSEGEDEIKYVPFSQRSEWNDVTPIKQDDGDNPICQIAYTEQFTDTMNYFRAILHKNERSERALSLTDEVITLNPANYTAWYFRRLLLDALKSDLRKELEYVTKIGLRNPKNYQIWQHRKLCVEKLGDYSQELKYIADHIEADSKNYHAWAYRQWVVSTYNLWDGELDYLDEVLKADMRNNSAWNQRYFVVTRNRTRPFTTELRDTEIDFAFKWIRKAPNNESPWVYLKGLFMNDKYASNPDLKTKCVDFREQFVTSPHVASLLVDIYQEEGSKESINKALELCNMLETSLDNIHRKFWIFRKDQLLKELAK